MRGAAKLRAITEALARLAEGDDSAIDAINAAYPGAEDSTCVELLHAEFRGAFSFPGGRREAVPPLLSLAKALGGFRTDDALAMYRLPAWQQLVALRGPVETVLLKRCQSCRHAYVAMGTSGFYDANGLVCGACGDVFFKSYYDDSDTPPCPCGAAYPDRLAWGCPCCGSEQASPAGEISPYEYFATHHYRRGPGA